MLDLLALLVYLFVFHASPLPFVFLVCAYCMGGKYQLSDLDCLGMLMFFYHMVLVYRMAGEFGYAEVPNIVCPTGNHTPVPTPLFTIEGYGATTTIYFCLAAPALWVLPTTVTSRWYFWTAIVSAFSVWLTVPNQFSGTSITMTKDTGIYAGIALAIPIAPLLFYSPDKLFDTAHVALFAAVMIVLIQSDVHVHHSQWPWALIPLMRHGGVYRGAGAAVLIGAATQEVCGSGFHLHPVAGY